jgi:hypothetical protein
MMYKLHSIAKSKTGQLYEVQGITIPTEVAQFFSGCWFQVEILKHKDKYGIYLSSGCKYQPTKEEIDKYEFADCRV